MSSEEVFAKMFDSPSGQITSALRTALTFPATFSVGPEIFLGFAAPIDAARELVIGRPGGLVIHLFGTQMAAGQLDAGEGDRFVFHSTIEPKNLVARTPHPALSPSDGERETATRIEID
jgi:hypothetical protein